MLCGVGVAYLATSVVGYLLTRADVREAATALTWMTGSLGAAQWSDVKVLTIALIAALPVLVGLVARLNLLAPETTCQQG